jgi:hypothetical protein
MVQQLKISGNTSEKAGKKNADGMIFPSYIILDYRQTYLLAAAPE